MIRKALSYAKYLSEEQMMSIIQRITNSEMSNEGLALDELITMQLNRDHPNTGGFIRMYLDATTRKNIYLHSDVPIGLKEYFIDTALDSLIENVISSEGMDINFETMDRDVQDIMKIFIGFCQV